MLHNPPAIWTNLDNTQEIALLTVFISVLALLVTAVIAITANRISKANAARQIAVAERSLYLSLLDKRIAWRNRFLDTIRLRDNEMGIQAQQIADNQHFEDQPQGMILWDLHDECEWLFDSIVLGSVNEFTVIMDDKLEVLVEYRTIAFMAKDGARPQIPEASEVVARAAEGTGPYLEGNGPVHLCGGYQQTP